MNIDPNFVSVSNSNPTTPEKTQSTEWNGYKIALGIVGLAIVVGIVTLVVKKYALFSGMTTLGVTVPFACGFALGVLITVIAMKCIMQIKQEQQRPDGKDKKTEEPPKKIFEVGVFFDTAKGSQEEVMKCLFNGIKTEFPQIAFVDALKVKQTFKTSIYIISVAGTRISPNLGFVNEEIYNMSLDKSRSKHTILLNAQWLKHPDNPSAPDTDFHHIFRFGVLGNTLEHPTSKNSANMKALGEMLRTLNKEDINYFS